MEKQIKLTNYSFLPNSAVPLDARTHFKNFAEANAEIRNNEDQVDDAGVKIGIKVIPSEESDNPMYANAKYYYGQIITTTDDGVWEVCPKNSGYENIQLTKNDFNLKPYLEDNYNDEGEQDGLKYNYTLTPKNSLLFNETVVDQKDVSNGEKDWKFTFKDDKYQASSVIVKLLVQGVNTNSYQVTIESVTLVNKPDSWLKHLEGGSGGKTSIIAVAPLNYDQISSELTLTINNNALEVNNQALTLKIDNNSPLTLTDSGLSLKIDTTSGHGGLTISENGLSLKLAKDSNLSINNKGELDLKLNLIGTHTTIEKTGSVDTIKLNNYIYQEI